MSFFQSDMARARRGRFGTETRALERLGKNTDAVRFGKKLSADATKAERRCN